jgi:hypothetical protein
MKIRTIGSELFYKNRQTDGQTDMKELTVVFRDLSKALKNHLPYQTSNYAVSIIQSVM